MKYAITGHTKGIGQEVYNRLLPNVVGFSRSNGYDISKAEDRARIIAAVQDCDVFINNADDAESNSQSLLFIELYSAWKNQNKKIINVGSKIADYPVDESSDLFQYKMKKTYLKNASQAAKGNACTVEYKSFGYVRTPEILAKYANTDLAMITIAEAADIILS